jgi:hypothetical protein
MNAVSPVSVVISSVSPFASAEEAWLWCATATLAACNGERLPGPVSPEQVMYAFDSVTFNHFEHHAMIAVGISGEAPSDVLLAGAYRSGLAKLEIELSYLGLI